MTDRATVVERAAARPGGRLSGWPAVALVGLAFFATMIGTTLPTPLYPTYASRLGFGELVTTVVFATYAVGVIAGLVLFGHWSDQLGRRPMLLAGLALSVLSALSFLLPSALGWIFAGRALSGLSAGIFTGTATATIIDLAPAAQRARASLVAALVNMAGLGCGPLLAGVLAQRAPAPTRLVFVVDLVLVALGAVAVLAVREPVRRRADLHLAPRRLQVPADARPVFVRAAIAGFAGFAVMGLFTAVSPAFLGTLLHHHSPALTGVVVATMFVGSVLGQLLSSPLGLSRALPAGCVLLVVGMVLVASSLPTRSLPLMVVGAAVAGLGQGTSFRAGLAGVSEASPEELRGEVTSTFFVTLYVGISLPVIGEGALAGAVGLVTAGIVFSAAVALLAVVALVLLRDPLR
jgi:MFS family permease